MHRASPGTWILSVAIFAVAASLVLALPVCAQSDEEQRRYEKWKQQQKVKGEAAIAPSAVTPAPGLSSPEAQYAFERYKTLVDFKAFVAAAPWSGGGFAYGQSTPEAAIEKAYAQCQKRQAQSYRHARCKLLAIGNTIVSDMSSSEQDRVNEYYKKTFWQRRATIHGRIPSIEDVDGVPYIGETGREGYRKFLDQSLNNRAFAISTDRAWGWSGGGTHSLAQVKEGALANCQKHSPVPCFLYAVNDEVVWKPQ